MLFGIDANGKYFGVEAVSNDSYVNPVWRRMGVSGGYEYTATFSGEAMSVVFGNFSSPAGFGDPYTYFNVYRDGSYIDTSDYYTDDIREFSIPYGNVISAENGNYSFTDVDGYNYEIKYAIPYVVDHFYTTTDPDSEWYDIILPGEDIGDSYIVVTRDGGIIPYSYSGNLDFYASPVAEEAQSSVVRYIYSNYYNDWISESEFNYGSNDVLSLNTVNSWNSYELTATLDTSDRSLTYTLSTYGLWEEGVKLVKYKWGSGIVCVSTGLENNTTEYVSADCYDDYFYISPIIEYVGGTTGEPVTATFESVGIENSVTIVPKGYYVAVTEGRYTSEYDYNYITVHTGNYIHYELEKNLDNELVSCVLHYEWEEYNEYLQMLVTCRYEYVYTIPEANIGQIEFYGFYAEGGIYSDGYIAGSGSVCPDFGQVIEITFNLSDQAYLYEFYTNSSGIPYTNLSYLDSEYRDSKSYAAETTTNPIKVSRNTNGTIYITREITQMNDKYYITYLTADGTYLAQYLSKSSHYRLKEDGFSSAEFGYTTVAVVDDLVIEPVFFDPRVKFEVFDTKNSEYADMSYVIDTTSIAVDENHETWNDSTEKNNTALSLMWGISYSMSSTPYYEDYYINSVSKYESGSIKVTLSQDRSTMVFEFTVNEEYYYNEGYDYDYIYNYTVTYKIKDKYIDYALFNDLFIEGSDDYSSVHVVAGNSATIVPSNFYGYFESGLFICPTIEVGFDLTFAKTIGESNAGFNVYQWNDESQSDEIVTAESGDSRLEFSEDRSVKIRIYMNEIVTVYLDRYIDAETNTNNYIFVIEISNDLNGNSYIYRIEYDLSNIENNSKYVLKYALNSTSYDDFIELESDTWDLDESTNIVCKVDFRSYEIVV